MQVQGRAGPNVVNSPPDDKLGRTCAVEQSKLRIDIKKEYGEANHGLSTLQFIKRRKCAATSRDEDFLPPPPLRPMRRSHHSLVPALVSRSRALTGILVHFSVRPPTG